MIEKEPYSSSEPQYRLGDAILFGDTSWGGNARKQVFDNKQCFKDSILFKYLEETKNCSTEPRWPLLKKITKDKTVETGVSIPANDELVLALRTGDNKALKGAATEVVKYIKQLRWHSERLSPSLLPVSRITIVTALHFGKLWLLQHSKVELQQEIKNNLKKINELKRGLETQTGLPVNLHNNGSGQLMQSSGGIVGLREMFRYHPDNVALQADQDFCYLADSKYLVLGNGHFSLCAAACSDAQCFIPRWVNNPQYPYESTTGNADLDLEARWEGFGLQKFINLLNARESFQV